MVEVDALSVLGTVVGVGVLLVGLAALVDLPTALAIGIGVALGQALGGVGSVVLGAGLVLLVRRG